MPIEKEVVENDEEIKKLVREKGIKDPEVKLKIRQRVGNSPKSGWKFRRRSLRGLEF
jgi:hypothetical protein